MKKLNVVIVGAGHMGQLRALSASRHGSCRVVHVVDSDPARASALAEQVGAGWGTDWEEAVEIAEADAVAVCTPHKFLSQVAQAALHHRKHVFCEKPMARTLKEGEGIREALRRQAGTTGEPKVVVGFTLRHHPAVARAHRLVQEGAIGQPFYIRAAYGHGGRPGYDQEWRMDPELGGGGELLDQGVHLIDLSRWFLGDFSEVTGSIGTYYWTGSAATDPAVKSHFRASSAIAAEDNAFLLLRTEIGQTASLHASWTQWKNTFQFEIFGRAGSLAVNGLGGSYGPEMLVETHRNPQGGVPEVVTTPFEDTAHVWDHEWQAFVAAVFPDAPAGAEFSQPANLADGCEVLRIAQQVYDEARKRVAPQCV